jgi:hypothetical protein
MDTQDITEKVTTIIQTSLSSENPYCSVFAKLKKLHALQINPDYVATISPKPKAVIQIDNHDGSVETLIVAIF